MTIARILKRKGNAVATIAESASVVEAIALLAENNFGALVVLDNHAHIVGILSERDIVRHLASGQAFLDGPVSVAMTADPLTCTSDGAVGEVLQMMAGWHIRHLPVVEDEVLLGMVSMGDLIRSVIDRGGLDGLPPIPADLLNSPPQPKS